MASDTPGQTELEVIVRGTTAFVMDFDGPPTAHIGNTLYMTLCSHGVKREGDVAPAFGFQEAVELYGEQLRTMIKANDGKQLAWRCRPRVEADGHARFWVYSRLAFIGGRDG